MHIILIIDAKYAEKRDALMIIKTSDIPTLSSLSGFKQIITRVTEV